MRSGVLLLFPVLGVEDSWATSQYLGCRCFFCLKTFQVHWGDVKVAVEGTQHFQLFKQRT